MSDAIAHPDAVTSDGIVLETAWSPASEATMTAIVTHPHPLMGGDMHNPVPAGVARGLAAAGINVLRANFRGTGASGGRHDDGNGERLDVVAMIDSAAATGLPVLGVGYSFGADVLLAVVDDRLAGVVAIAPPLRVLPPDALAAARGAAPTLLLSAEHDQFRDAAAATAVAADWPRTETETIPGADHFLAGSMQFVVDRVLAFAATLGG